MKKPIRIQRKRTKGWKMPENTVYVGRPTKWGNPFKIGTDASRYSTDLPNRVTTIDEAISCYRYWLNAQLLVSKSLIKKLKGKDLACWCKEGEPCHADILLELANR